MTRNTMAARVSALEAIPDPVDLAADVVAYVQLMREADGTGPMTPEQCEQTRDRLTRRMRWMREAER